MRIITGPQGIQGSDAWKQFRSNKISATMAGAIAGLDPFKSPEDVYDLMMGITQPEPSNAAMRRGNELEPIARDRAIEELEINFTPAVVQHDEHDWAIASLDGLSDCKQFILEIKSPSKARIHEEHCTGQLKRNYYAQIQWQLWVTGARLCYFCSYFPGHKKEIHIRIFNKNMNTVEKKNIIDKCRDFYFNNYLTLTRPGWVFNDK